ncbi:MAG: hypothetical protein KKD18_05380 [Nanoarchaeota archaeon]|nr:hypothetical protein [Nanoarchaeota archaeon]MBU0977822.1 hypothetical protein [Nanoarchaeota archaeon]
MPEQEKRYLAVPIHELPTAQAFSEVMDARAYKTPVETIRKELTTGLGKDPTRIVSESEKSALRAQKAMQWAFYEIVNGEIDTSPF